MVIIIRRRSNLLLKRWQLTHAHHLSSLANSLSLVFGIVLGKELFHTAVLASGTEVPNAMNARIDGLDSMQLLQDIVEELTQEFPGLQAEEVIALVQECKARMPRPATGGALFLEAQKIARLINDRGFYLKGAVRTSAFTGLQGR